MLVRFFTGDDQTLSDAVNAVASDPAVDGVCLLVGSEAEASRTAVASVLDGLSVPAFGAVFPEVIHHGEKTTDGVVVIGFETAPAITTVDGLDDPSASLREQFDPELLAEGYGSAFVFVDAHATRIGEFLDALFDTYGVELSFVGGGAGTLEDEDGPTLFTGGGSANGDALVAMLDVDGDVGVRHGWQEVGGPFRVTKADGNELVALDGDPAFEVYRDAIEADGGDGVTPDEFFETAKAYPFGIRRLDSEDIVRDPYEVRDDGTIACFGPIPSGEFLHVLHGDASSLPDAAHTAYRDAVGDDSASGTLAFFDCISRVQYLGDEFPRELRAVGDDDQPSFGALTIGEIANGGDGHLEYYNKTAVVASLTER